MIGQTLNRRYRITALLGEGAMGEVYRATDAQSHQEVAIKFLTQQLASDKDMLERFRREGEALRQLRHANIVAFIDTFPVGKRQAIVMEFVAGGSLHARLRQGPLPLDAAVRIALDLSDALARAHRINIIHRDIKPDNVLLDTDGTPKITDFGVARLADRTTLLTGTGTQIGTPQYMSPEAWEGKPLDAQADIWSLGVVLYEMLSGQVPFGGDTLVAVMNKVLNAPLPDVLTVRTETPPALAAIIRKMLTRDKAGRYHTMRQAAVDLEAVEEEAKLAQAQARQKAEEEQKAEEDRKAKAQQAQAQARQKAEEEQQKAEEERKTKAQQAQAQARQKAEEDQQKAEEERKTKAQQAQEAAREAEATRLKAQAPQTVVSPRRQEEQRLAQEAARRQAEAEARQAEADARLEEQYRTRLGDDLVPTQLVEPAVPFPKGPPWWRRFASRRALVLAGAGVAVVAVVVALALVVSLWPRAATGTVLEAGPTPYWQKDGMMTVYVPAGNFFMGSLDSDPDARPEEKPPHPVTLDAYWIDLTDVTNAMYVKCVADNKTCKPPVPTSSQTHASYYTATEFANYPVVNVTWNDAYAYCAWAGRRLPTEAQWENAARGTEGRMYPWGNQVPDQTRANFAGQDVTEVGHYQAGATHQGVLDMAGNVWQWMADYYDPKSYSSAAEQNPIGLAPSQMRVVRGGSWYNDATYLRSAGRSGATPDTRSNAIGFRCALKP